MADAAAQTEPVEMWVVDGPAEIVYGVPGSVDGIPAEIVYVHMMRLRIVDKWRRFIKVFQHARHLLNRAVVIGNLARRRFSGEFRYRVRQPDQLDS